MTGPEVTAAMKAEDVPDSIALALAEALNTYETSGPCPLRGACGLCDCGADEQSPERQAEDYERALDRARHALAAVLPDARYAAKVEAITEARRVISQYLSTAERWRYDRVMWAFAIMLGEIPEDSPCPDSPADARERAARLTATTEEREGL